jgi:ribosomal protein L10
VHQSDSALRRGEWGISDYKKSLLKKAIKVKSLLTSEGDFQRQISLVIGAKNSSEIAKLLKAFHSNRKEEKLALRRGLLGSKLLSLQDIARSSELPRMDIPRA